MTNSPRADFRAKVDASATEHSGKVSMRVVVDEGHVLFRGNETELTVPLDDVFDVSQDVPGDAGPTATVSVTLGLENAGSREMVTVQCEAETLAKFQLVLFKLLLDGTPLYLAQTSRSSTGTPDTEQGRLTVSASRLQFQDAEGVRPLPRDEIEGFETQSGSADEPKLEIHATLSGTPTKTLVRLPSYRRLNLLCRFLQSNPDAGQESGSDPIGTESQRIDILAVDDDPADLEMIEMVLTNIDDRLEITTTTSAPSGLNELASGTYDCVVSDYGMPGTDGIEFLRQVRDVSADLPFILFTGQGSEAVAKEAIISDATDYVEKGIGTDQYRILQSRIEKAVR